MKSGASSVIQIESASEHNLKGISLSFPHDCIHLVLGPSGSGKSSLMVDTLYRFAERSFLRLSHRTRLSNAELLTRPDVVSVSGLRPAILVEQHSRQNILSRPLYSLTDIGEFFRRIAAREAKLHCASCDGEVLQTEPEELLTLPVEESDYVEIRMPLTFPEKRIPLDEWLKDYLEQGFERFSLGEESYLFGDLEAHLHEGSSLALVLDRMKGANFGKERLGEAWRAAGALQSQSLELFVRKRSGSSTSHKVYLEPSCVNCGSRGLKRSADIFHPGRKVAACDSCKGTGSFDGEHLCETCQGTGLRKEARKALLWERGVQELLLSSIEDFAASFHEHIKKRQPSEFEQEFSAYLHLLERLGLGKLHCSQPAHTLSRGELQRLQLSGIFSSELSGFILIFDEPSLGLSCREIDAISKEFLRLAQSGNTLIIIDHDPFFLPLADRVIELGPGPGKEGGELLRNESIEEVRKDFEFRQRMFPTEKLVK